MSEPDYDFLEDDYSQLDTMIIDQACEIAESQFISTSPDKSTVGSQISSSSSSGFQAISHFTTRSRTNEEETPSTRLGRMSLKSPSSSGHVSRRDGSPTHRQLSIQHMGPRAFGARNAANSDSISNAPSDTEEEEEAVEDMLTTPINLAARFSSVSRQNADVTGMSNSISARSLGKRTGRMAGADNKVMNDPMLVDPPGNFLRTLSETSRRTQRSEADDLFFSHSQPVPSSSKHPHPEPLVMQTHIIAHSKQHQVEMDNRRLAWGVQYEIARGITRKAWKWEDVSIQKLAQLQGKNADAAWKVAGVMLGYVPKHSSNTNVWEELDREQLAIVEPSTCQRSLGVYGDWENAADWYGGRVIQIARLVRSDRKSPFFIQLESMEYQRATTRLARFLGSRRIIRMSIPVYDRDVEKFLNQKFILCGRTFVSFKPRETSVYLVEVQDDFDRVPRADEGDGHRLTFADIVSWHNPMNSNSEQPIRKWVSRFDLALSPSIPVLEFRRGDILYIDDEYAPTYDPRRGKPSAEQIVTDGCGFMNRGALSRIAKLMRYEHIPTAVQGRIAGAKGLWLLHPEHQHDPQETPKIWIRKSQNKILLEEGHYTRAHLIFDLVAPNRLTFPARLSKQTIINLAHNAVPHSVFKDLMEAGMNEDFEKLTTWEGENAMKVVLHTVAKMGNVAGVRLQREAAGMGRALGYGKEPEVAMNWKAEVLLPEEGEMQPFGRKSFSLEPTSLGEKIFEMIAAGFHPLKSHTLNVDLRQFLKIIMDNYIKTYHIPNRQSCEAFIVPDPFGVLDENEIYFQSWQAIRDAQADCVPEILSGLVLMNRNPTRLPSDIQLVYAVDDHHEIFQNYRDVIVCSTKGDRSLASKLAGGDYDGDTAMLTWMPEIVQTFEPPPLTETPPDFMETNFKLEVETVSAFQNRMSTLPLKEAEYELHRTFFFGLGDIKVARYSRFHDNAIWKNGYDHPSTIRIAYMFTTFLDATKTGLQAKDGIVLTDEWDYGAQSHPCLEKTEPSPIAESNNRPCPPRERSLGPFVLEVLRNHGETIRKEKLIKYDNDMIRNNESVDQDIISVLMDIGESLGQKPNALILEELSLIKNHVDQVLQSYRAINWAQCSPRKGSSPSKGHSPKTNAERELLPLRQNFAATPKGVVLLQALGVVQKLKASYAFKQKENFAFSMAYRDVCEIKASARGNLAPMQRSFTNILGIPASFARLYTKSD